MMSENTITKQEALKMLWEALREGQREEIRLHQAGCDPNSPWYNSPIGQARREESWLRGLIFNLDNDKISVEEALAKM
jgi:hypothetical protein